MTGHANCFEADLWMPERFMGWKSAETSESKAFKFALPACSFFVVKTFGCAWNQS